MQLSHGRNHYRTLALFTAIMMLLNCFSVFAGGGIALAAPSVTATAEAAPSTAAAGSSTTINVNVTSTEKVDVLVDVEIFDASLKRVHQMFTDNISLEAGVQKTVPFNWNIPAGLAEGKYIVSLGVFGAGWSSTVNKWFAGVANIQVTKGTAPTLSFTSSATAAPAEVKQGGAVAVDAAVTANVTNQAVAEVSLVAPSGAKVLSQAFTEEFQAGVVKHLPVNWNVPADAAAGVYQVQTTVFNSDRSQTLHTNAAAGQFTVAPSTQEPTLPAPADVKATAAETAITLAWSAVAGAESYEVEADGVVVPGLTGTSYTHSGLAANTEHSYRVRAVSAAVTGAWSAAVSAKTLEPVSAAKLKVQVKTGTSASTQMPTPEIEIFNTSKENINLADIKARYYFTIDGEKPLSIGFWTTAAKQYVKTQFVKMPIPSAQADYYLEISFAPEAGVLKPNSKVGVYTWINKSDWSKFDQSNDYSYNASTASTVNDKATAYRSGVLDWGVEPVLLDIPSAPVNIQGTPTDNSILVTWDAVAGATGYDIDADGTIIENISGTSYLNEWLNPGTRHTYKLRTRKGSNLSIWSGAVTFKTTGQQNLPAPVNVRGKTTENSVTLTWNALEEYVTGYEIEVDGKISGTGMATSYVHSGLAAGTKHTYRVRAVDGTTVGKWSEPVTTNTVLTPTGTFDVQFTVDTSADRAPISPYIYGTNDDLTGTENWTARREGGNRLSTYNWENNASNAGDDYFHNSDNYVPWYYGGVPYGGNMDEPGIGVSGFHNKSLAKGAYTLTTLQMAGYVAKDKNGSVSPSETAPSNRWVPVKPAKNAPFSLVPDLNDNAVYVDEFVNLLVNKFGNASTSTGIKGYSLDNEPSLWQSTHPYMHPTKPGAYEVLSKGIETAKAVKKVDPYAEIYGPAAYSFDELYSMHAADDWNAIKGSYSWYMDYYLDKFRVASAQENKRLLDAVDFHWYPEISAGGYRITDAGSYGNLEANKARMQAPRSLWDPTYTENSWIGQWYSSFLPILPRTQQSIDKYNPGTKIAVTEYNYGGEDNIYGGIAQADVLGIFGKYGVHLATFWKMVNHLKEAPYITAAVKLFTNYDGNNGKFGDTKVKAETSNIENSSIYGSVDSGDRLHLIVMNKNNDFDMNAVLNIAGATQYKSARVFALDGGSSQIKEIQGVSTITNNAFTYNVPKLTVVHIVLSK